MTTGEIVVAKNASRGKTEIFERKNVLKANVHLVGQIEIDFYFCSYVA